METKLIFIIIALMISLMTSIITLLYLGTSFNSKDLKLDDWKRKFMIFFAYFNILTIGILAPVQNWACVLTIISSTIILCYLGTSFDSTQPIDSTDWKRRWLIIMAYFELVIYGLILLTLFGYLSFRINITF